MHLQAHWNLRDFKVLKRDLKYNYICVHVYELHRTCGEGHSQGINRVMNLLPCNS